VAGVRTYHHARFEPAALARDRGATTVAVCLPARDEAATVGTIVTSIRRALVDGVGLVDEVVVVDDHSTDDTAAVAAAAGARVVTAADVAPTVAAGPGKGRALWSSVLATDADVIAWCDADLHEFDPAFVTGLVGPLLTEPAVGFVKGYYERPEHGGRPGGGRVTELCARPALALLHPAAASVIQPLSGEYAARRTLVEALPFVGGYGVDVGLLLDAIAALGPEGVAQVDLGERRHRNRDLAALSVQATEVLHTVLDRAGVEGLPDAVVLDRPAAGPARVRVGELPPPRQVPGYRRATA